MKSHSTFINSLLLLIASALLFSCSTVKVIPEGETLLKENIIEVESADGVNADILNPYLRQQPNRSFFFGWKPFLSIYNWRNFKENGWDRFVTKLGHAPVLYDSLAAERSLSNIETQLNFLGYYHSKVEHRVETKGKKSRAFYDVELGKRYKIDHIEYEIRDREIRQHFFRNQRRTLLKEGAPLSEELLEKESERITSILRDKGYYNFSKFYFSFEADTLIGEGLASLKVKIAQHSRTDKSKEERSHLKYYIRDISLYSDHNPIDRGEEIEYRVREMPNFTLYDKGSRTIRSGVLDKMNTLRKGELYSESEASNTYNRLTALRYFSGVNIQFDEVESDTLREYGEVDCTIRLTPSKSQGYKINIEGSSNSNNLFGVSPAISYYHKNLFRGGEWFTLGLMGNFQFKLNEPVRSTELGISTGITFPNFLLLPDRLFRGWVPTTEINMGLNYQSRPEFTRNLISFIYKYNWRVGERFYYNFSPIQLNVIKLFNISPSFVETLKDPFIRAAYRDHFDLGSGVAFYYTTDASTIPTKSFFYVRWINDVAGNIISLFDKSLPKDETGSKLIWKTPYAQYVRSDFTVGYTYKTSPEQSLALRFNIGAGWAYGNSRALPFEKLFYAGGANSLRGWQPRSVGPGSAAMDTTFALPNQTGDFKLEGNIEYRFNMFWLLEGALFVDAGNIWTLRSEPGKEAGLFRFNDFKNSIAVNWGTGLRLNLDFVVLRLDLGVVARDPIARRWLSPGAWFKKDTYALQFGVGYPF